MAVTAKVDQQGILEADLRKNWRWLSVISIERPMNRLLITLQDDQQPSDKFLFEWDEVPAYAVRDESFAALDEGDERGGGGPVMQCKGTRFIAWATEATWTHGDMPLLHWRIAGSDDVIDVASVGPPVLCKIP